MHIDKINIVMPCPQFNIVNTTETTCGIKLTINQA